MLSKNHVYKNIEAQISENLRTPEKHSLHYTPMENSPDSETLRLNRETARLIFRAQMSQGQFWG